MRIAVVSIVVPKKARRLLGAKGNEGALYVMTLQAARLANWKYFTSRCQDYAEVITNPEADTLVTYILNGVVLEEAKATGELLAIRDREVKSIDLIDKEKLMVDNVHPRRYIVAIKARKPKWKPLN